MSSAINRRTFKDVTTQVLREIGAELSGEIEKKLKRAEFMRKTAPGMARDYEAQADGLIDASTVINMKLAEIESGAAL